MTVGATGADGVLLAEHEGTWWAWYGVRVTAATDVTQLSEYRQLDRASLLGVVAEADRGYLATQLGADASVELRWSSIPGGGMGRLDVLGTLSASSEAEAVRAALAGRRRLVAVPRQVVARELGIDELDAALHPFDVPPAGMAELRKRWIVDRPQRPDAPWPYYSSSPWLREVPGVAWASLVRAMASAEEPVVLSVNLRPQHVPQRLSRTIAEHAAAYRRLAESGETRHSGLWNEPTPLAPDPGAVTAGQIFEDAGQRYTDRVFHLRISLASAGSLPAGLLTLVREVMSPGESAGQQGFRSATLAGTALQEVVPHQEDEVEAFRANLESLTQDGWGVPRVDAAAVPYVEALAPLGQIVDLREATALFRFPLALDGTLSGFPVVRPREGVAVDVSGAAGAALVLGHQHGQERPVTVPLGALTSHTLVVGSTGSGKTSSVLNLLEQLWGEHRTPFLVIEPVNADRDDYRWLLERPGFESMLVFTIGDESLAPFRLNPFEVPAGVRVGTHLASLVSCFDAAFGLTGPLPFLYRKALKTMYTRVGISPDEVAGPRHAGRWPRLKDLVDVFSTLEDIDRYAGEVRSNVSAASRLRTESLLTGSCGRTLDAASSYPIDDLLSRPVVLELAAVGDDDREQALVIAFLLNALTGYYKATRKSHDLAHVTVIEEAHRLLRRPKPTGDGEGGDQSGRAAEQFANTLAENRKYGEGLIIVEQVPAKLIEDAHKNTATKVMHHLPAVDDRAAISATMNLSEDQEMHARSLDDETAYVTHREMGGRAGLVDVPNVRRAAARARGLVEDPLPGSDVVRQRFEGFIHDHERVWDDLAPFPECDGCMSRCQFRGIGEVVAPGLAGKVKRALNTKAYPDTDWERKTLWRDVVAQHERVATSYDELNISQRADLAACTFMHAAFLAFPGKSTKSLVARYRKAAAEVAP